MGARIAPYLIENLVSVLLINTFDGIIFNCLLLSAFVDNGILPSSDLLSQRVIIHGCKQWRASFRELESEANQLRHYMKTKQLLK